MQLQERLDDLREAGIAVVAISYDPTDTLKEFADEAGIQFPLLADTDSKTIDAYGIRNRDIKAGSTQDGIPHPGTFLVDDQGIVRGKLFYSVRVRHSPDELIEMATRLKTAP